MNDVVGCAPEVVLAGAHLLQQLAPQPRLPDPRLKFSGMVSTPGVVELHGASRRATAPRRNGAMATRSVSAFGAHARAPTLAPGMPQPDLSVRVHKLEHDLTVLQRKFSRR
jgi:hypothetical protein